MGPKHVAATCASAPLSKDLSWIDRMYMKFETMCVEVDKNPSLLLQETSKYVESQVNAVGVNVKKLCTELIQDLISTPMLSPEGIEKKLECALHCKCHCLDSERPKLNGMDTAGFDGGDDSFDITVHQKQDTVKKEGSKIDNVKKEICKVETLNKDITSEPQNPKSFEVCGPEFNNIHGQDITDTGEKLETAVGQADTEDIGGHKKFEQKVEDLKSCTVQQGESSGNLEGNCRNSGKKDNNMTSEQRVRKAAVYRGEAVFAEQTSRRKSNDDKEPFDLIGSSPTYRISATKGIQEESWPREMLQSLQGMQAIKAQGLCKRRASDIDLPKTASHLNSDGVSVKYKDTTCSADNLLVEDVKKTNRVGGSFQSMYSENFSELQSSTKEEELLIMPEWFSKEHDNEQSAHWLVGEDLRKALEPEIFSVEKSPYGECFIEDFDLDWELL